MCSNLLLCIATKFSYLHNYVQTINFVESLFFAGHIARVFVLEWVCVNSKLHCFPVIFILDPFISQNDP